jgi:hypothetical protein
VQAKWIIFVLATITVIPTYRLYARDVTVLSRPVKVDRHNLNVERSGSARQKGILTENDYD